MTYRFIPTKKAGETGVSTRAFVKEHHDAFIKILKPLLPYIIALLLFDALINAFYTEPGSKDDFTLGALISNYFFACLMISWHRVVLNGPDNYVPVNPLKPKKHELIFMGMALLLGGAIILLVVLTIGISFFIHPALLVLAIFAVLIAAFYAFYKCMFYFPSKAVDNTITLRQSARMTKGYIWSFVGAAFYASWRVSLAAFGYLILGGIFVFVFGLMINSPSIMTLIIFLIMLPIYAYFQPLVTILGVTVLSNYYQHALQNKQVA